MKMQNFQRPSAPRDELHHTPTDASGSTRRCRLAMLATAGMGTIHRVVADNLLAKYPTLKRILEPFLHCFSVTVAERVPTGTGGDAVYVFYLKPDASMVQLLGLEREMLALYAPFAEFQARTIEVHDEVLAKKRSRLDPLGSVIVSDAANTKAFINSYLMQEPERSPIVALQTSDLGHLDTADALKRLFLEHIFRRDLFGQESPVTKDSLFFGRQELTVELFDRVRNGQNSGLFGLRRMGKTSVLYAVGRRLAATNEAAFSYIFLGNPSRYKLRWRDLLHAIVRTVAGDCPANLVETSKIFALRRSYSEEQAADHFRADMRTLLLAAPGKRIVLGLDELEHISFDVSPAPHWNEDFLPFWQTMRALHQEVAGRFAFIIAGVNPHALEQPTIGRIDNPMFETARLFYLPPFRPEDIRNMVGTLARFMGIDVADEVYSALIREFGGHPFLTRKVCSAAISDLRRRPASLTYEHYRDHGAGIALEADRVVRQILGVLGDWYPSEFELLRLLAQGDAMPIKDATAKSAALTQHIEGYGLVREARTNPTIAIGAVRTYLLSVRAPSEDDSYARDWESIRLEISRRRNAIELALRDVVAQGLRFRYGPKAGDQALKCWPESRRAILQQYSYAERWTHLDFKELNIVVQKEWDVFQNRFAEDRDKVLTWLDQVNRSRADAHAKTLSEEDLAFVRVSLRRLEELLDLAPR